jgi:hypothetical protein
MDNDQPTRRKGTIFKTKHSVRKHEKVLKCWLPSGSAIIRAMKGEDGQPDMTERS